MVTNKILELNSPNDSDNPELQTQKFNQIESVLKVYKLNYILIPY